MFFIRAILKIFSFVESWNVPFNSAPPVLNRTFHLSTHENIRTIALISIHYLYSTQYFLGRKKVTTIFNRRTLLTEYNRVVAWS